MQEIIDQLDRLQPGGHLLVLADCRHLVVFFDPINQALVVFSLKSCTKVIASLLYICLLGSSITFEVRFISAIVNKNCQVSLPLSMKNAF